MAKPRSQTAQEVANQRAGAIIDPQLEAIRRAQEEADARAAAAWQRQQEAIAGYSQAAAAMLQPVAGQVTGAYQNAADFQAAMGKAFSAGFQDEVNKNAAGANALLAQNGSPQQVQSAGVPGGDVLMGLGGFIPASTLSREGAAFGAAAAMLPSTQLGYGSQRLQQGQQQYATDAENRRKEYDNLRQDVLGTRGDLIQKALADIRQNNFTRQQLKQQEDAARAQARKDDRDFRFKQQLAAQEYGLDVAKFKQGAAVDQANLDVKRANARTAQARVQAQIDRDLRNAGIQDEKLRIAWGNLEVRQRGLNKKKGQRGLTAKQRADYRGTAAQIAEGAYHGIDPDPARPGDKGEPPIGYQQALREMYMEGVPLAIAQQALNQYYKPGERGRPRVSYQERQRRKRANRRQSQGARNAPR